MINEENPKTESKLNQTIKFRPTNQQKFHFRRFLQFVINSNSLENKFDFFSNYDDDDDDDELP